MQLPSPIRRRASDSEEGFLLVAMIFAIAVILIFLAVAAPSVAKDLQHERELETIHRGNAYVRAIRVYYRRNGQHYPTSIDQLLITNNERFLRQKYIDPMTGKDDWRIIHVGENKTQVTGYFGEPLEGLNSSGIGSSIGSGTQTTAGSTTAATGGASQLGQSQGFAGAAFGNTTFGANGSATNTTNGTTTATTGNTTNGTDATDFGGGGGPIMGVSSLSSKSSIISIHEMTTYNTWEFIYDPRIELLYAKSKALGGGGSSGAGGLGLAPATGINAGGGPGPSGDSSMNPPAPPPP
jgi:type II secretory pathway pseudopilin PulG